MSVDGLAHIISARQLLPAVETEQWLRQAASEGSFLEANNYSREDLLPRTTT